MSELLPEWPDENAPEMFAGWDYQHARADAAMARLRVAVEALRVAAQARSEVRHAKEVGPDWYTHGERGMHAQVLMWDGKAGEAVARAINDIGELPPE